MLYSFFQSLFSLLEALDYYVPCSELCLARNKGISKEGIERLGTFISKVSQMLFLEIQTHLSKYTLL